jgi:hypothetical protein
MEPSSSVSRSKPRLGDEHPQAPLPGQRNFRFLDDPTDEEFTMTEIIESGKIVRLGCYECDRADFE